MPRRDLTFGEKYELLEKIKSLPPNTSQRRLAQITGISKSTIARLLQNAERIRNEWLALQKQSRASKKRKRDGKDPEVEEALNQWFLEVSSQGIIVNRSMLHKKAEELAEKLNHWNFKVTSGWMTRWLRRHDINLKLSQKEENEVESSENSWLQRVTGFMKIYSDDDIYNADVTGLYYQATPDGMLNYDHSKFLSSKKSLDRLTVLCCTNMSGNDKKKLLVVGKTAKPRCFKGLRMESLPVEYYSNKTILMTNEIFTKWLTRWDTELELNSRKILLVINDRLPHQNSPKLQNIQLEYFPQNSNQPLKIGILNNLKLLYRGRLVRYIVEEMEMKNFSPKSTALEIGETLDLLQALQFMADSWRQINSNTINNCFAYCYFELSDSVILRDLITEAEATELQLVTNNEEYSQIDELLDCCKKEENWMDTIFGYNKLEEENVSDVKQNGDDDDIVSVQEAKKCISRLRRYFMQDGNEGSPIDSLNDCADFVNRCSLKNFKRLKSEEYF